MAISTVTKNLNDGTLVFSDGTSPPVTLTVPVSVGDTTIENLRAASTITGTTNATSAYTTRGKRDGERANGERTPPAGAFSCHFRQFTNASAGEPLDFIRFTNAYSANVPTNGANADVKEFDIILTVEGTTHGDGADHVATLSDCDCVASVAEGDPNILSVSYTAFGDVAFTGPA